MSYLEQYDSIPIDRATEKVQLVTRWIRTDWRPFFKELRENRPILITPNFILVTLFHDVQEVLSRENIFSVRLYIPKMDPVVGGPFMKGKLTFKALHSRNVLSSLAMARLHFQAGTFS